MKKQIEKVALFNDEHLVPCDVKDTINSLIELIAAVENRLDEHWKWHKANVEPKQEWCKYKVPDICVLCGDKCHTCGLPFNQEPDKISNKQIKRQNKKIDILVNKFIKTWVPQYYSHLVDTDDNDGQKLRNDLKALLKGKT